jgi:hypothetical protein
MAKRRVRLNDENDPLSSTDKVLAGFEQVSKSTSQPDNKLTSQEDSNSTIQEADKPTNQEDKMSTSQPDKTDSSTQTNPATNNRRKKSTRQEVNKIKSQPDNIPTSQIADQIESLQDSNLIIQEADKLESSQDSTPSKKQVDFPASQQVTSEKVTCRKSTFQINQEVLHLLDKLHLTLQLELGKSNAPYKEVIVEEALVRLLEEVNSDREALISVLVERQKSRDKI